MILATLRALADGRITPEEMGIGLAQGQRS
jgi:hypothetical protein